MTPIGWQSIILDLATFPVLKLPSLHKMKCLKCQGKMFHDRMKTFKRLKAVQPKIFISEKCYLVSCKWLGCWTLKYSPTPYCEFLRTTIRIPFSSQRNWINYIFRAFYSFYLCFFQNNLWSENLQKQCIFSIKTLPYPMLLVALNFAYCMAVPKMFNL